MNRSAGASSSRSISRERMLRIALGVFLLLTCLQVWIGPYRLIERAEAQIPDAGLQRKLLLEEVRHTNALLAEIKHHLLSGTLNTRMEGADNQSDSDSARRSPGP